MAGIHSAPTRRHRVVRRLVPLVVALALFGALAVWAVHSADGRSGPDAATTVPTPSSTTVPTPSTATVPPTTTTLPPTTTTVDPGALAQTDALPSATSPQFLAAMQALFAAIAAGTPAAAHVAYFPQSAYLQLKDIGDASGDYQTRLLGEYDLDILAATAELGPGAATASLTGVDVPMQYAHWVPPGTCYNSVGYYEVANSRMVYTEAGVTRSFGIASLISWRGEWYVVHLGAVLRPGSGGVVLDPETGVGTSAPSSTC
jgi:hypothetical protein